MPDDRNRIKKSRIDYVQLSMHLKTPVPLTDVDENNKNGVVCRADLSSFYPISLDSSFQTSALCSVPPASARQGLQVGGQGCQNKVLR